ncbi:MAG: SAM-dependent methyltransferase, partial [Albidovulum sp.]|nr:SAM-dependent methyltransferase [Albidovulum sp.]
LIQCRLALGQNGKFLCVLLGGATLRELRHSLTEAEILTTGGASPRVAPMGDIRDLGDLLQRAGFADAVADSLTVKATYSTALALMQDLRFMGETNALDQRIKAFAPRMLFLECARIYGECFARPDGRIPATFELIFLTARAPDSAAPDEIVSGKA